MIGVDCNSRAVAKERSSFVGVVLIWIIFFKSSYAETIPYDWKARLPWFLSHVLWYSCMKKNDWKGHVTERKNNFSQTGDMSGKYLISIIGFSLEAVKFSLREMTS